MRRAILADAALMVGLVKLCRSPIATASTFCASSTSMARATLASSSGNQHVPLSVDALADRQAQPARHQRRRQVDVDVVLLEPVFVADLDHVAKAFGGQQRGLGALALDQRVGRKRGAVDDESTSAG